MVIPYGWQLTTSFKTFGESLQVPPTIIPRDFYSANYNRILTIIPFWSMLSVSFAMTIGRVVGQLVFASLAAYGFARLQFRGRDVIFIAFLSVMMIPYELFIIPQYEIMQSVGWLDSIQALIVPRLFNVFGLFLLRQFLLTLPVELEEAARIDGANPLRIFWSIILPLVRPGLITLAIFTTMASWQDLLWPIIVNSSKNKLPISAGLANLSGEFYVEYPVLMAGSVFAMLPLLALFVIFQRQFIEGIATTGGKS